MLKILFLTLVFVALMNISAEARYIGRVESERLCHAHVVIGDTDFAESDLGRPRIYVNPRALGTYPSFIQRFIIRHECAHTHGISSELGADRYALKRMYVTKHMANKLCNVLREVDDEYETARCHQYYKYARGH